MLHPSHEEVADLGYRPIPIIPPLAPLSPNSQIKAEDRGKIPGKQNADELWAGFDWLNTRATLRGMAKWYESGAGVGIVCGEPSGVIGLDIDCMDPAAADMARQVAEARLGVAPVRIGRAPKLLLVFRIDPFSDPIRWRKLMFTAEDVTAGGEKQLVEVRGFGQQFVAYGIHPVTNEPYDWPDTDGELPPMSALPIVDAEDIADYFELLAEEVERRGGEVLQQSTGATGGGVDRQGYAQADLAVDADKLDQLDDALSYIPNTSDLFPTRDDYIKMGCAIKAAFAEDESRGEQAWLAWAYKWEDGTHGDEEPERDWQRMKPPFEIGAPYLVELAREHGWKDAHLRFEPLPIDAENERPVTSGEVPVPGAEDDATDETGTGGVPFWDRYVWVEELERFVDLREKTMLNMRQFALRFPDVGKGPFSQQNAATVYLENTAMRRIVRTKTYRPGQALLLVENFQSAVNTWSPGPIHSDRPHYGWRGMIEAGRLPHSDDDVAPYLLLAEHLFPDNRERGLLLDWLAFQIQHPGVKCSWHPVIGGEQGIGKDSLVLPVLSGLGTQNTTQINPSILAGQWTHWAENKQVVVVQEMNNFERKATMDKMKPYLACPPDMIEINVKGLPQYQLPNIVNLIFFTNHPDAVALEKSDRRFGVFWSNAAPLSAKFFEGFWHWLQHKDGIAAVCAWLAAREIGNFDSAGRAPYTAAKETMRREAMPPMETDLMAAIDDGVDIFANRDLLGVREVSGWLRHTCGYGPKETNMGRVGRALAQINGAANLGRISVDGNRFMVWSVRGSEKYQAMSAKELAAVYEDQANIQIKRDLKKTFKRGGDKGSDGDDGGLI